MHNTRPMSGKSGFHPCTACNPNIPQEDKHTLCAWCLGVQHATLALERDVACSIMRLSSPRGVQGGWEEASQLAQEDTLSIAASGEGASSSDMQVGEPPAEDEPGFELASEARARPLSSSVSALMGHVAALLQVP
ncbi:UNVERIFIED_CONTAM: hypothetical protein FKN15_050272 [Acipenser sinensis]